MPKILDHKEAPLRRTIRDAMAIDPLISLRSLQSVVEAKMHRSLDLMYISKIVKKVQKETQVLPDQENIASRIAEIRETNRIVKEELMRIAFPDAKLPAIDKPGVIDRRKALEAIARIENAQAKLEMDFGLFVKNLGEINVNHRLKPLDEETRSSVIKAFEAWGLPVPMRKIEAPQTITVESKEIPHEPAKQQHNPISSGIQPIPSTSGAGLVSVE